MDETIELPDGLTFDDFLTRWPFSAEKLEMVDGGPIWVGGPWTAEDGRRAERLLRGWRAYADSDGYSLWLVAPDSDAEREARRTGYVRLSRAG